MFRDDQYKPVASQEGSGNKFALGVKILTAGIDLSDEEKQLVGDTLYDLHRKLWDLHYARDPETIAAAEETVERLTHLFLEPIYVERIPNEYGGGRGFPWLLVTTKRGRIKIGWRRRVIEINWSGSEVKATAQELFPDENVTKEGCLIHAWGYDDARKYPTKILAAKETE